MFANEIEDYVLTERVGHLGIITLNRPRALNALNVEMVRSIARAIEQWDGECEVDAILLRSGSSRAFCAGGDVRAIGILSNSNARIAMGREFFGEEFALNQRINRLKKPFISLIDGVAMGGGLGISLHGSHRVVSENVKMGMPENLIGYFPDVGATWFLNRCPGHLGRFLALTGTNSQTEDAIFSGFATHHVPASSFQSLESDLVADSRLNHGAVDSIIRRHCAPIKASAFEEKMDQINEIFGQDTFEAMLCTLEKAAAACAWFATAHETIMRSAPTSIHVTWKRMVEGRNQSIETILRDDYRVALGMVAREDFAEGIRAVLVDKDHAPKWKPGNLFDVNENGVEALLKPLGETTDIAAEDLQLNTA
ncbi:enoyl-CoA hydratase [Sulfitobacter dubius]|nr:enoyl-CoA hydratase [Sulfitobacter dubius]